MRLPAGFTLTDTENVASGPTQQLSIPISDYDRALSQDEIFHLLHVVDYELETLIASDFLTPSLTLEYHNGLYLGFFNFWDCMAAEALTEALSHLENRNTAFELIDEALPQIALTLTEDKNDETLALGSIRKKIEQICKAYFSCDEKTKLPLETDAMISDIAAAVAALQERFRILTMDGPQHSSAPYAIHIFNSNAVY